MNKVIILLLSMICVVCPEILSMDPNEGQEREIKRRKVNAPPGDQFVVNQPQTKEEIEARINIIDVLMNNLKNEAEAMRPSLDEKWAEVQQIYDSMRPAAAAADQVPAQNTYIDPKTGKARKMPTAQAFVWSTPALLALGSKAWDEHYAPWQKKVDEYHKLEQEKQELTQRLIQLQAADAAEEKKD